jgi:hypothetical protein
MIKEQQLNDDFVYNNEEEAEMGQLHAIHNNMNAIANVRRQLEQQAAQPSPGQHGLDLQGGMTEEQMIEQLYAEEAVQKQQEAQRQQQQQQQEAQARAQTAKQILDDEIALADERVRLGDLNRREAARLDLLHPVLENPSIENTAAAFQANLKRAGYANTELTDTEKALIQKANDMKAALLAAEQQPKAEEVLSEPEAEYAAPNKLTPKVTGIPLKQEKGPAGEPKPKEPEQKYLKGIGRPQVGEETQTEEAAPEPEYKTVLDASLLDSTGLSKQSGFYRQLYNKDMANPQDQVAIGQTLAGIRTNPNLSPNTKQAVESIAMQAFNALAEQQKMFGPRGAVLKGAENGGVRTGPVNQAGGKSVPLLEKPRAVKATERAAPPKPRGVASTKGPVGGPGVRKETKRGALVESKPKTKATKPPVPTAPTKKAAAPTATRNTEKQVSLRKRLNDLSERLTNETDRDERQYLKDEMEMVRLEMEFGPDVEVLGDDSRTIDIEATEISEEDIKLLTDQTSKLSAKETATLEKHYGVKNGTDEFFKRVREDVITYTNKGAEAVAKVIRDIIKKLQAGVLAVAVVFNPAYMSEQSAVAFSTVTTQVQAEVPSSASDMSDSGKKSYSALYPALQKELQTNNKYFTVVDKPTSKMFVFNPDGSLMTKSNVVLGKALGDMYVGKTDFTKNRITPAGLFKPKAEKGSSTYDGKTVYTLGNVNEGWNAVFMHTVYLKESDAEARKKALATGENTRLSHGCVNGPVELMQKIDNESMDGSHVFIVPDNQSMVDNYIANNVSNEDLTRETVAPVTKTTTTPEKPSKPGMAAREEKAIEQKTTLAESGKKSEGEGRFRAGQENEGMDKAEVETQAKDIVKGWRNAPPVKTVQSESQLPKHLQEQIKEEGVLNPKGVWDPRTQSVFLIGDNLAGNHDIAYTVLHEIVGHFGLQKMLGSKFDSVMNGIYNGNADVKGRADIKIGNGMQKQVAVEEVLAEMAETATNPSLLQKVVNIIRQVLKSLGVEFGTFTNGEIMQLLQDSRKFVTGSAGVTNGGNVRLGGVFNADAPVFYSQLAAMVAGAPKQFDNASEEQWRTWINGNAGKNQVKEEELQYSGINEFLNIGRDKANKISRKDLLEFLKDEGIQVEENIYGEPDIEDLGKLRKKRVELIELKGQLKQINSELHKLTKKALDIGNKVYMKQSLTEAAEKEITDKFGNDRIESLTDGIDQYVESGIFERWDFKNDKESQELYSAMNALYTERMVFINNRTDVERNIRTLDDEIFKIKGGPKPRFNQYTLEGGYGQKNYRELVLRLPKRKNINKYKPEIRDNEDGTFAIYDENGDEFIGRVLTRESAEDIIQQMEAEGPENNTLYSHIHWPNVSNPVVHIRFNEKTDDKCNRVLFVEELQSDWGQAWGLPEGGKLFDLRNPKENAEARKVMGDSDIDFVTKYSYDTDPEMAELFNSNFVYFNTITNDYELVDYAAYSKKPKTKKEATQFLMGKGSIPKVASAPFVTEPRSYTALAIKRLLRYAADNGYDKISFINGTESHRRFPKTQDGESTEPGMKAHYDVRIPSVTKDVFKQLGANPNSRIEKITITGKKYNEYYYTVKKPFGEVSEPNGPYIVLDEMYATILFDSEWDKNGFYPQKFTEDMIDPDTQQVMYKKGQEVSVYALGDLDKAGYDMPYLFKHSLSRPVDFSVEVREVSPIKDFFTIDLTPEASAKIKQGQAMFSTGAGATFRNNPAAPGVNGNDAQSIFDSFVDKIEDAGILNTARADALHEFLKNGLVGNARKAALSVLPVKALTMEAERAGLKMAPQINTIIDQHSGYVDKLNKSIEPLVRKAEDWIKTALKAQVDLFNKVVYDSTTLRIDPTKAKKEETTQAEYDKVKNDYNRLTPQAKQLYVDMRNGYKAMYDEILASIEDRINTFVTDPATKAKIKKDILEKLAKRGEIDPYFALTRKGKYWLSYNLSTTRNGETTFEPYIEAYETQRERNKQIALLQQEGAEKIQEFSQLSDYRYTNAPSGSFVNKILNILEVNRPKEPINPTKIEQVKYDKELKAYNDNAQEVMNLYLSTLPETSFAQSFQKRKDTLGFRRDAVEALRDRMYNTSQQLGRMRYSAKLNKLLDDMREYSKAVSKGVGDKDEAGELLPARDNKALNDYISMFEKHVNFIINPKVSKISSMLNTIGFNYLLGFNISSAAVNLAQVPMIVAPYLAGEHGWGETMSAINDAYKLYLNSGYGKDARTVDMIGSTERVSMKAMPSIDNYGADTAAGKKYATLIKFAQENGQLNRSQFYDVLEVDGRKNWSTTLNAATGFAFHHGERMNRQVSIVAAYNLQMNKLASKVKSKELTQEQAEIKAAEYALSITEMTNGGVSSAGAPLIAKNNIGKVLFMFKRYGVSMYYMLFKITRDALQNQDKDVKRAAMRQIAGVYGTAALFSGLQGIPMFGVAAMVYNLFADDDEDDMETATRKYVGEFAYKGMLNYVTGAEVASRFSMSDLIFRSNPSASSHTFEQGLLENLGGPVYGVASRIKRGLDMMNEGNMQRGVENVLPSAISNILKSYRYGTEGAKSLRGDPIVEDVNAFSIAAQALGFAPAEYVRQLEINSQLKGVEKNILQKKSKLLQQYNIAKRMGDNEEAAEHKQELLELNKKHPKLEITADTFERSERAFKAATKRTVNGVQFSQKLYDEMMKNAAEYDR